MRGRAHAFEEGTEKVIRGSAEGHEMDGWGPSHAALIASIGAEGSLQAAAGLKVKVKVGKSLHRLNFPVLTSSFRPLFDLPDAPSAVPPTSSEWVPGRPVPKPWRF